MNGMAASDKIFALPDLPEPEEKGEMPEIIPTSISMRGVQFAYEEERDILKDISMELASGSFTAIIGTVVLVSHRTSTMNLADVVVEMENVRVS